MNAAETTYRQLADSVQGMIEGGTLRAGDRLPSLRSMARDYRVSVTTVMSAYEVLENRSLVDARNRSGFFVRARIPSAERLPKRQAASAAPRRIERPDMYEEVISAINDPTIVPLGCAVPSKVVIPDKRLASISAAVLRKYGAGAFSYSVSPGRIELRHQIVKRMLTAGVVTDPSKVIVTSGATESLCVALEAVTKPGDLVAVETPTFFGILRIIEDMGLKVVEIPVSPSEGIHLDTLESAAQKHPLKACVVQPNFQNPTGSLMSAADRSRLVKLADKNDFVIIEDDLYADLAYDGKRPTSLMAHDTAGRVIHCGGASKSIAPGLRVGWLVSESHLAQLQSVKNVRYMANPTLSELIVASFLSDGGYDRHLRRIRSAYQDNAMRMREAVFAAFPEGTRVNSPAGGFVLWIQLPQSYDAETLARDALEKRISMVPGSIFSASGNLKSSLRLSCGFPFSKLISDSIRTLGELCQRQCV
jgi:DNA-binding transcriptional MocR family regulator